MASLSNHSRGIIADLLGLTTAIYTVAGITALSGFIVAVRMYETHPRVTRSPRPIDVDLES